MNSLILLFFVVIIGFVGPLVHGYVRRYNQWSHLVQAFVLASIGGSCLFHVLPDTYSHIGHTAIWMSIIGFLFPTLLETITGSTNCDCDYETISPTKTKPKSSHLLILCLLMLGLSVHALLDGTALEGTFVFVDENIHDHHSHTHEEHAHTHLGFAILLHRLPEGFLIYDILQRKVNILMGWFGVALISLSTILGFFFQNADLWGIFTTYEMHIHALVAGGLCHVIFHHALPKESLLSKQVLIGLLAGSLPLFLI